MTTFNKKDFQGQPREVEWGAIVNGLIALFRGCQFKRRWCNPYVCKRCGYPVTWHYLKGR
jgi:hypothetical protein